MDTNEQINAMAFDRHMSVMANAGSGKTRVLVNRFVNILLSHNLYGKPQERLKTSEIVAITFTRKAAAEMRAKIIRMIEEEIGNVTQRDKLEKLYRIREELSNARVSTIHSFCSALLREFPIEADVNPAFIEIPTAQLNRIRKESILFVLEDWLESSEPGKKENAEKLLLIFGRNDLENMIGILLDKFELFNTLKDFYTKSDEAILSNTVARFVEKYLPAIKESVSGIYGAVSGFDMSGARDKLKNDHSVILGSLEKLLRFLIAPDEKDLEFLKKLYSFLQLIRESLFTKSGSLAAVWKKVADDKSVTLVNESWKKCSGLSEFFEALEMADYDSEISRTARVLLGLTEDIKERIDAEKAEMTGLDFGDMIVKVHRLLDNSETAGKIRKRIRYLLVDEFQDTDNIQYEIIRKLVPGLTSPEEAHGGSLPVNLFIVGDTKQSIYGFRNADIRVFETATKEISRLNGFLLKNGSVTDRIQYFQKDGNGGYRIAASETTPEETEGRLKLTATFRLQPAIAAFINSVCRNIMTGKESEFDVKYTDFVCGRNTSGEALTAEFNKNRIGFIIRIAAGKNDDQDCAADENETEGQDLAGAAQEADEAELLAGHIRRIMAEGRTVEDEGIMRRIEYRDIAILARTRSKFQSLENALIKNRIPYILHSGRGYLNSQEVTDLTAFLNFINDQSDDVSLVTILRSPFFSLTDASLLELSANRKGKTYWEKLSAIAEEWKQAGREETENGQDENNVVCRARDTIGDILEQAPVLQLSQLINAILDKTGRYGTINNENKRDVVEHNINCFMDLARDYEQRSFTGFYDFIEEVNFMRKYSLNDTEPADISDANSVNIMTIHASKGLEFPVVYFYDTASRKGQSDRYFLSDAYGFRFKANINSLSATGRSVKVRVSTPSYVMAKFENDEKNSAEDKRLLYVALSRARDYLFITGTVSETKAGLGSLGIYLKLIMDGLGWDPEILRDGTASIPEAIRVLKDGTITDGRIDCSVEVVNEIGPIDIPEPAEQAGQAARPALDGEIPFIIGEETVSPSAIMMYRTDPWDYVRKYVLGMEPTEEAFTGPESSEDESPKEDPAEGTIAGTAIHAVMEKVSAWLDDDGNVDTLKLTALAASVTDSVAAAGGRTELRERIITECGNACRTKLLTKYRHNLLTGNKEWELHLPVGDDFLKCIIDAAVEVDGNIEVWDWKTNRVDAADAKQQLGSHYEVQMKTYCYLMMKARPGQSSYKAKLLFTRLAKEGAEDEDWTWQFAWTPEQLDEFGNELVSYIDRIKYSMIV